MGVLASGSAHARPSALPLIDTGGNFSVHMSAEKPPGGQGVGVRYNKLFAHFSYLRIDIAIPGVFWTGPKILYLRGFLYKET
jgi:hypothetical protein